MTAVGGPTPTAPPTSERLDSWKEIAAYLNRSLKTVQRWEREEALPVHRHLHGQLGSVYAWRGELDRWWEERRPSLNNDGQANGGGEPSAGDGSSAAAPAGHGGWKIPFALVLTAAVAALGGAGLLSWLRSGPAPLAEARVSLDVSPAQELNSGSQRAEAPGTIAGAATAMAWTPDGRTLVFIGQRDGVRRVYVRPLDAAEARPLANTEGARVLAVSPDGAWVAFWVEEPRAADPYNGTIKKVSLRGGPAMTLAADVRVCPRGLAWDDAGRVMYGREEGPIEEVTADGRHRAVSALRAGETRHVLPSPLPGGRAILYTVRKHLSTWGGDEIVAQTLATGERKVLVRDAVDGRYVPPGYLVYLRRGVLFAVRFDARRLDVQGREVPVLEPVGQALVGSNIWDITGAGQFAVSSTGSLAWVPRPGDASYGSVTIIEYDRAGRATVLAASPRPYVLNLTLSPDGGRLAVKVRSLNGIELWTFDLERGTFTPLNRDGESGSSAWSPDGRHIAFRWVKDGQFSLGWQSADGSAPPSVLARGYLVPTSFTPDGRQLLAVAGDSRQDIVAIPLQGDPVPVPVVATPAQEAWPAVSPDGRWLAYGSNETGRPEVYIRPLSGGRTPVRISLDGGDSPAWNSNGRELFFLGAADPAGRRLMAADFSAGPAGSADPRVGRPRTLFVFPPGDVPTSCQPARCYEAAPDGRHFFAVHMVRPPRPPAVTHASLILNWTEELKARVGGGGR